MSSTNQSTPAKPSDPRLASLWAVTQRIKADPTGPVAVLKAVVQRRQLLETLSKTDYLHASHAARGNAVEAARYRQQAAELERKLGFHPGVHDQA